MHRENTIVEPVSQMTSLERPPGRGRSSKSLIDAIGDTTCGTGARQILQALPSWENQGEKLGS
jgi:hypothetical protein